MQINLIINKSNMLFDPFEKKSFKGEILKKEPIIENELSEENQFKKNTDSFILFEKLDTNTKEEDEITKKEIPKDNLFKEEEKKKIDPVILRLENIDIKAKQDIEVIKEKTPRIRKGLDKFLLKRPITLLEEKNIYTADEIINQFPAPLIVTCDFGLAETDIVEPEDNEVKRICGGWRIKNIINIDHHAPTRDFMKYISSTNLAIDYVKDSGAIENENIPVIINHTDCDSILSSSIIRGIIPPHEEFGLAAISADHTGEKNKIADLLQAIQGKRDVGFSLRCLDTLLEGGVMDEEAEKLLEKREKDRERIKIMVEEGLFKTIGRVSYIETKETIDTGLIPSFLSAAMVIIIGYQSDKDPKKRIIKIRLGNSAPEGLSLKELDLPDGFGGRWNAGANKRAGGTEKTVEEYVHIVNNKLAEYIKKTK